MWTALFAITLAAAICFVVIARLLGSENPVVSRYR
jgi:hypothetical protein